MYTDNFTIVRVRITVLTLVSSFRFLLERVGTVDVVLTVAERAKPSLPITTLTTRTSGHAPLG